jgi:hypothetical protein
MVAIVGITLGLVFAVVVIGRNGLLFVSQPLEQAPNDKDISLATICLARWQA